MLPVLAVLLTALISFVVAKGFVHFEVEKRTPDYTASDRRRQSTDTINAQVFQNIASHQEYLINLNIGSSGQRLGVTIDTGSTDLWVPSASFCKTKRCDYGSFDPSLSLSYKLLEAGGFNITYAAPGDSDAGDWVSDSVSVGNAEAVQSQIFGLSNAGLDTHGVLGLGFDASGVRGPTGQKHSTFIESLAQSGLINRKAYSMYLNAYNQRFGSIAFGGIDSTKYSGDLVALPLQPAPGGNTISGFYATLSKVTFTDATGTDTVLTPDDYAQAVLLDSGTSFTSLTNDVLERLASGMGAVAASEGTLTVPCRYNATNATVGYTFGGSNGLTIKVPISETIGAQYGGECVMGFGPTIIGLSVLGDTFLRSAYVVFDIDNQVVALAQAVDGQTGTSSIAVIPSGTSLPGVSSTASGRGTQLNAAVASASPTFVSASWHRNSIIAGTPTFNLGTAALSGSSVVASATSSSTNVAVAPAVTGLSQAALWGAGLVAGALML